MQYIKYLYKYEKKTVTLHGWVANKRSGKGLVFILLRDGSGFAQCVVDENKVGGEIFEKAAQLTLESSLAITGKVVKDEKQIGGYEIHVSDIKIYQIAEEYPIAKKEHGVDFLMDKRHLWIRARRQWAILKIRNQIIYAIHNFFQERDFVQVDSPIFTGNAAEGTTTLFETDFYGQPAYLAQTGQLYNEAAIMSLGKIYTFGPTFRAEKSKTRRHLSEFWMMEPEMAFYDAAMNMDLIEAFLKYVIKSVLEKCKQELKILERDTTTFEKLLDSQFPRMTYTDAVAIIKGEKDVNGQNALKLLEGDLAAVKKLIAEKQAEMVEREERIKKGGMKKGEVNFNLNKVDMLKVEIKELKDKAENIPQWIESANKFKFGNDFGGSDETVLTRLFDVPIMVYNWPKEIKAFYMKDAEEDSRFVQALDVLAPEGFGEIVGGSVREEDKDKLIEKIKAHKLPIDAFEWYIDLRRFGTIPHAGFGLGLERFVTWIANLNHIRESIPFPRMYGRLFP